MPHLKRYSAPETWKIERKTRLYTIKPAPGAHAKELCLPLAIILRDYLKYARNLKEVKKIIKKGSIIVNGKPRKDYHFGAGILDILSIKDTDEHYVILLDKKGKLVLKEIDKKEADKKLCKIVNKTMLKNAKLQLNLHDGGNLIVDEKDKYKTKDSIIYNFNKKTIEGHLKYEPGALVFLIGGANVGEIAKIKDIIIMRSSLPNLVELEAHEKVFRTTEDKVIVIGKEKPVFGYFG